MSPGVLIEACVDSLDGALQAEASGADRVELCVGLDEGGLTPPNDLLSAVCARLRIPVHILVRPRAGDFRHDRGELDQMLATIDEAKRRGARGIVAGILTPGNLVDVPAMVELLQRARPLAVTFHRAFDLVPDPEAALEGVVATGVSRILTSGLAPSAEEGIPMLTRLVRQAQGRVTILAGGSIREHNVAQVVRETGVTEIHARTTGDPSLPARLRMALRSGPGG